MFVQDVTLEIVEEKLFVIRCWCWKCRVAFGQFAAVASEQIIAINETRHHYISIEKKFAENQ